MPKLRKSGWDWILLSFLLLSSLWVLIPKRLQAQQAEIPPPSENPLAEDSAQAERVVSGRPPLYHVKRIANPIWWFQTGIRPLVGLAGKFGTESGGPKEEKTPSTSGIKFGVRGHGPSSGFGPEIKPFDKNLFNTGIEVEVPLSVTYKLYESFRFRVNFPLISHEATEPPGHEATEVLGLELTGGYASRPSDSFFGIGNDTPLSNESRFRTVSRTTGLALDVRPAKSLSFRVGSSFRSIGVTQPRDFRSVTDVFQPQDVPGLMTGATMFVSTASIQRDTTDHPHMPASGGLQRVEFSLNEGVRGGDFSYYRYRADLQQFLPLTEDRRAVIALRAGLETNQPKGGSKVPFFDLPYIGSSSTVRGFMTRRFSDRSVMTASAEYRYRIWQYLDLGLFADAGQVAPEIANFAMDRLHTGYGARFYVRSHKRRGFILDIARSPEQWAVYLDFSPLF